MRDSEPDARGHFEHLYREHYGEILRYAARRVDADTARDVAAEVFASTWRRLDSVPAHAARAWLFTTARNALSNEYRTSSRRRRLTDKLTATVEAGAAVPDPAQQVVDRDHVLSLLAQLPEVDREALELTEWDQLTASEAARVVGCSAATFRVRLHRARRRLLALYELQPPSRSTASAAVTRSRT